MTAGEARTAGTGTMDDDTEVGAEMTNMVKTAEKNHAAAVEAVEAAKSALDEAQEQLAAALVERDRLDTELDGGASIDAAEIAAEISANQTTTEALTRLKTRRADALTKAETAAEDTRKRVALAKLQQLADDLESFDPEAEKARLVGLVQDEYSEVLETLYGFEERISEARRWAEDAQGLGVAVTVPARFDSSARVQVEGRALVAPATVDGVRAWFAEGLVDERAVARQRAHAEANRRRLREAQDAQARQQQAQSDAMPRVYGDTAEAVVKAALR